MLLLFVISIRRCVAGICNYVLVKRLGFRLNCLDGPHFLAGIVIALVNVVTHYLSLSAQISV